MNAVAVLDAVHVDYTLADGSQLKALNDVSLEVRPGELVVFVGASGSGKTTALNVISGLTEVTAGRVAVLGKAPAEVRRRLGYMFARDALMAWRTAQQNVEFGLEIRGEPRETRRQEALRFLSLMKLDRYTQSYPSQLSHGQRQRVALARTWVLRPDLMLMDEPFAALDAQTREELQSEFVRLWGEDRRSGVFVTHDLGEAIKLADRIVVFAKGRIVAQYQIAMPHPRDIFSISESHELQAIVRDMRSLLVH